MDNVNIAGGGKQIKISWIIIKYQAQATEPPWPTSSSSTPEQTDLSTGALSGRILIFIIPDRSYSRAFPMVSSLIGPQYNNDQFWKFSASAAAGSANNFDTAAIPAFSSTFEVCMRNNLCFNIQWNICSQYAHFHGTDDGAIKYEGQNPGPAFLNSAEVISAQLWVFWIQSGFKISSFVFVSELTTSGPRPWGTLGPSWQTALESVLVKTVFLLSKSPNKIC